MFFVVKLYFKDFNKYIYRNCEFECRLYFPIPAGMNKVDTLLAEVGAIRPVNNKDWDNLGKTYYHSSKE